MQDYAFDFELETMFTMFIAAIDEVIVKRFNQDKSAQEHIKVRFLYAPKQRVLADLLDKAQNIQLPVVSVTNGGVVRDQSRVFNKIQGSYITGTDKRFSNKLLQPVPVDVTVNVSILTRYQKDFDQIITNICSYFDPYIVISWRTPSMQNEEIRSNVIWSGTISTTYPSDIASTQVARIQGDTSFTIKGWLFKARPEADGNIYTIKTDYSLVKDLTTKYSLDQLNPDLTERFILSAIPQPQHVTFNAFNNIFTINGKSFFEIEGVYLSGGSVASNSTFYNLFSSYNTLSANNPGFTAYKLPTSSYNVIKDNEIITTPLTAVTTNTNIIIVNEAGYGTVMY